MAFKSDSSDQEAMSEINVTPLVDVMLVLLVVFIVTAPLLTQAVHVKLPKTEKASPAPEDHVLTVSIAEDGQVSVNDKPQGLDVLEQRFREQLSADPETTVRLHADAAVPYGKVAQVMAIAQHAGLAKLAFITEQQ